MKFSAQRAAAVLARWKTWVESASDAMKRLVREKEREFAKNQRAIFPGGAFIFPIHLFSSGKQRHCRAPTASPWIPSYFSPRQRLFARRRASFGAPSAEFANNSRSPERAVERLSPVLPAAHVRPINYSGDQRADCVFSPRRRKKEARGELARRTKLCVRAIWSMSRRAYFLAGYYSLHYENTFECIFY